MTKEINWEQEPDETLVCYCSQVNKGTVVAAIRNGSSTVIAVQVATGAGVGSRCKDLNPRGRCCHPDILGLLKIYKPKKENRI